MPHPVPIRNSAVAMLRSFTALALCLFILRVGVPAAARQTASQLVRTGNRLWDEHSYRKAAIAYSKAIVARPNLPERPEIEIRMLQAHMKSDEWDAAVAASDAYQRRYRGTAHEAPGLMWRARLFATIDREAYRVGKRVYRGSDAPAARGNDVAVRVNLSEQDSLDADRSFLQCRMLLNERLLQTRNVDLRRRINQALIQADFDRIARLGSQNLDTGNSDKIDWTIDLHQPYDSQWPPAKQIMYLYTEIAASDGRTPGSDRHSTLLARCGEAFFIMQLRYAGSYRRQNRQTSLEVYRSIPYAAYDPIDLLSKTVREFHGDPDAARIACIAANWTADKGDARQAVMRFRAILAAYPKSPWAENARASLHELLSPSASVTVPNTALAGHKLQILLTARNLSRVNFTAYRINLDSLFQQAAAANSGNHPAFRNILNHYISGGSGHANRSDKVAEWNVSIPNSGLHQSITQVLSSPLSAPGAYLIVMRAGSRDEISSEDVSIISDITVVQKVDLDSVLVYAADACTGKPLAGLKLMIWANEIGNYDDQGKGGMYISAVTDSRGIFHSKLPRLHDVGADSPFANRACESYAYAGPNRFALTGLFHNNTFDQHGGENRSLAYLVTDRPLYHPGQTLYYRVVAVQGMPSRYKLLSSRQVRLRIESPRGKLLEKVMTTDQTGAINDSVILPPHATPGDYSITAAYDSSPGVTLYLGRCWYRVEEYKKPEYTVAVTPDKPLTRFGGPVGVTVAANYFFGSPVAYARVHYKIFRAPFTHPLPDLPRLNWSPDEISDGRPHGWASSETLPNRAQYETGTAEELFREGDLTLDGSGMAKLTFASKSQSQPSTYAMDNRLENDIMYRVEAAVSDDSRGVVTGSGAAITSIRRFHAAMRLDHEFMVTGDTLKIEINTQDSSDKPIDAVGSITVWRQVHSVPQLKRRMADGRWKVMRPFLPSREEKIITLPIKSEADAAGTGTALWQPDALTPGDYVIRYDSDDGWGHHVNVNQNVLVYGAGFDDRLTDGDDRGELLAQTDTCSPGETARLLVVAPGRNCSALLTEQVGRRIVRYQVITIPGRSMVVDIPISSDYLPNAAFTVSIILNGKLYSAESTIRVASAKNVLTVTVSSDRSEYRPGERVKVRVHLAGAGGEPVAGEVTLGIVDEALLSMQPGANPRQDIISCFYGYTLSPLVLSADSIDFYPDQRSVAPIGPEFHPITMDAPPHIGWLYDTGNYRQDYHSYSPYHIGSDQTNKMCRIADPLFANLHREDARVFSTRDPDLELLTEAVLRARFHFVPTMSNHDSLSRWQTARQPASLSVSGGPPQLNLQLNRVSNGSSNWSGDNPGTARYRLGSPHWVFPGVNTHLPASPMAQAAVRSNFADTAVWIPAATTNAHGDAEIEFNFPDNITKWCITARAITTDVRVGAAEGSTITRKNLIVRIQAPRFFIDRDRVTLSANIHNYLSSAKQARVELFVDNEVLSADDNSRADNSLVRTIQIDKDGEQRIDWSIKLHKPGTATIRVVAQTDEESDAQQISLPVLVHGVEKLTVNSGTLMDSGSSDVRLNLPEMRRKGMSVLNVQLSPSLAAVMIDALPYLEDYPYGCVEQTLSRFVPTVTVARALRNAGIDLEAIGKKAQAMEELRNAAPPEKVENSVYTYPQDLPGSLNTPALGEQMYLHRKSHAPIFDSKQLASMAKDGLTALYDEQRQDGGWGWWKGSAETDPFLTAYAMEGLTKAKRAGFDVDPMVIVNAASCLDRLLKANSEPNCAAYMLWALSEAGKGTSEQKQMRAKLTESLYSERERLSPSGQALVALTLHAFGRDSHAMVILRNLETTAILDTKVGTVHWESHDREYWHWYNDKQETTALVLLALVAVDHRLSPPDLATMAVRWLVDNRRAGHWVSTRQTADVVYALLEYARDRKELSPDYTVTVDLDGKVSRSYKIDSANALVFDNRFVVGEELLVSGGQTLHISKKGQGTLYWTGFLRYFDTSEPIRGVGNAISVTRKYYKITPPTVTAGKGAGPTSAPERLLLSDGAKLQSGDIVEVELYIKSSNDYEYVMFEDMKPAGCEALETRSGEAYCDGLCSNLELRDASVAFFIDRLPQGTRKISYRVRAEIPGEFHALPANGYSMYAPDIRAASDEWRVSIGDLAPRK